MATSDIIFGTFVVTSQVFYKTNLSMGLVNLKPILPGHVLVCPRRVVLRYKDMTVEEIMDHALAVQKVTKMLERVHGAAGANIAIQDGGAAGQSVPHVHTHIIPRKLGDLSSADDIYPLMDGDEGNVGKYFDLLQKQRKLSEEQKTRTVIEDSQRHARTLKDMEEEAKRYMEEMERGD